MPIIGEIQSGLKIGKNHGGRYIWCVCEMCGNTRWTKLYRNKPVSKTCLVCSSHRRDKRHSAKYVGKAEKPILGDLRHGNEIGYDNSGSQLFAWIACPNCGRERWVQYSLKTRSPQNTLCQSCAFGRGMRPNREKSPNWKGGRSYTTDGYIFVSISPTSPYYSMRVRRGPIGYVLEHRLVMAQHLGRCLQSWEIVHHKNGIKDDNRIENLELSVTLGEHIKNHSKGYRDGYAEGLTDGRDKRIQELKAEVMTLTEKLNQKEQAKLLPYTVSDSILVNNNRN